MFEKYLGNTSSLAVNNVGKTEGMIGIVRENITGKYLSVKSIRIDLEFEDITNESELDGGSVAFENYR